MKIAGTIFESLAKAGGYEIFTYNLFKTLAERGHEVQLYLPHRELRKRGDFYAALPFPTAPMIPRTHSVLKRAPWLLRGHLAREQARHGFDVWQAMGAYPEAWAIMGLKAPKVLRCYGEDVQLHEDYGYGMRLDERLQTRVLRALVSMDRIIAMTPSLEELLVELAVEPQRIRRVPNGIDAARFGKARDAAAIRKQWNIPEEHILLLTVGRNHAKKGFCLIPAMASRLKNAGLAFTWLVVGGATERLQPAIDSAGVSGMVQPVKSLGAGNTAMRSDALQLPVDELLELYSASDVFILPSRLEGFSRVLIEAMAAGLPVVTTDAPGCGETFTDGEQGFVLPVEDDQGMAEAILTLARSTELREKMSAAASDFAKSFDWACIAEQYEAVYRELMEEA